MAKTPTYRVLGTIVHEPAGFRREPGDKVTEGQLLKVLDSRADIDRLVDAGDLELEA